ncbi:MAG: dihydrofolate reductase family protein [Bacteroidales bacterium]
MCVKKLLPDSNNLQAKTDGKDIWLVGGGELTTILLHRDLIVEMQIAIVPTILGEGLRIINHSVRG